VSSSSDQAHHTAGRSRSMVTTDVLRGADCISFELEDGEVMPVPSTSTLTCVCFVCPDACRRARHTGVSPGSGSRTRTTAFGGTGQAESARRPLVTFGCLFLVPSLVAWRQSLVGEIRQDPEPESKSAYSPVCSGSVGQHAVAGTYPTDAERFPQTSGRAGPTTPPTVLIPPGRAERLSTWLAAAETTRTRTTCHSRNSIRRDVKHGLA
jgi:hypothetical protein